MNLTDVELDNLKKRGFLKAKQEGMFTLRTRASCGNYSHDQLIVLSGIAKDYGKGFVHATTRQGVEVPFIRFEDIEKIEEIMRSAGIYSGTSGPRLRPTTTCPGNNWCKRGLVDTFHLFERIEKELGFKCDMDLPHKFKIAISGCPNACTRVEASEIGIHGAVDNSGTERKIGYAIYLGGCGGRTSHIGFKLNKIFSEDEVLGIIKKVVNFHKENAKPRQRLALLIKEIGRDNFLKAIGQN